MNIAIVGCGFVADYYMVTLAAYPELRIVGVYDRDAARAEHLSRYHSVPKYETFEDLLSDDRVQMVLNLTNPGSHYEVSRACLEAGKHVYSEKPFAMKFDEATRLVELAEAKRLRMSSAPCSLLGETAQTVWRALREHRVGVPRVVYAEMDDGMVHRMAYRKWVSVSGIPWPAKDEFEVGCTFEHAGYYLSWFPAFFGPAKSVTAFSSALIPDKETDEPLDVISPDFSVACITFSSGVVARLTCSIVAPHDHTMRIVGDKGVLAIKDSWFYRSPVKIRRPVTIRRKTIWSPWKVYPLVEGKGSGKYKYRGSQQMDFARGVAELASAIRDGRPTPLSERYCLHTNELVIAIHEARENGSTYQVKSTFDRSQCLPGAGAR
ncbi:MAG TPA: Gfo/Idh/MocA family oxidoreductase [Polyangiaceae bacterium]|nr:Gfo/Idh/MocA family oxidoreductase [Polyangiaceae bacterium]